MLQKAGQTVQKARSLRRAMTLPEVLLWQELRKRPSGYRFRRQHPAGSYVLDFYCAVVRLCIEVDGEAHERGDRPARDSQRDAILARHGIFTLRILAVDVLADVESVVAYIVHECGRKSPLHHPAAPGGPPPQA